MQISSQIQTVEQLKAVIAQRDATEATNLMAATGNRPVTLPTRPQVYPEALVAKLEAHNAACAALAAATAQWQAQRAALPALAMEQPAGEFAATAAVLKERRLGLLRERLNLTLARKPLIDEVAAVLATALASAEAALEEAREKGTKLLAKAGDTPEADPRYHQNGHAAEVRHSHRVNALAPVQAAEAWRREIDNAARQNSDFRGQAAGDAATVTAAIVAAAAGFIS